MVVEWEEKLPQLEWSILGMEKMGMEFRPIRIMCGIDDFHQDVQILWRLVIKSNQVEVNVFANEEILLHLQ